jgi:TRAP transporter TAXI family solute receptor
MDVYFVPFDEAIVKSLSAEYIFYTPATVPAGTYRNQEADFNGLDVGSMHLITTAGQDEDLVYRVTRALYGNRAQVVQRHAAGNAINPKNVVRDTGTEFHPGAIRYYREIGIWPE